MITIIAGTNRKRSMTALFARHIHTLVETKTDLPVKLLDLSEVPSDWFHKQMYDGAHQSKSLTKIQDEYVLPAQKFIFVAPEYNGSIPGVLKMFIDACSVRNYAENFKEKKAALLGVASGRAGNLRGLEHLTGILHYLGTHVMPNRLPVSSIGQLVNDKQQISDEDTLKVLNDFVESALKF